MEIIKRRKRRKTKREERIRKQEKSFFVQAINTVKKFVVLKHFNAPNMSILRVFFS